jgi:hypothetical protein
VLRVYGILTDGCTASAFFPGCQWFLPLTQVRVPRAVPHSLAAVPFFFLALFALRLA